MVYKILEIQNLFVKSSDYEILKNFNLKIFNKETHIIMGPNGSGKSTLCKVLTGHPSYQVLKGNINFFGKSILTLLLEDRLNKGLFLAFQNPIEISGFNNFEFLKIIYNEQKKFFKVNTNKLDFFNFFYELKILKKNLELKNFFFERELNKGFSGGEKKRNEILQMLLLKPSLAILDEIDSGLDMDALKLISTNINSYAIKRLYFAIILITHYAEILKYLKPSYIHIMINGKIIKTGSISLLRDIENYGYKNFVKNY